MTYIFERQICKIDVFKRSLKKRNELQSMFLHIFLARSWQLKKVKVSHEENTNVLYTVHRRSNNHSRCFCHQHQCCDYLSLSFNICRQTILMIFLVPRYDQLKLTFSVSLGFFHTFSGLFQARSFEFQTGMPIILFYTKPWSSTEL